MPKIDFNHIDDSHSAVHTRLLNWSRWVTPTSQTLLCPMFRQVKSAAWQWHTPEIRETVDILDAIKMEKQVCSLPDRQRLAIKWAYVQRTRPGKATRRIAQTDRDLMELIRNARQSLTIAPECVI